jgi:hypothetical protein
VQRLESIIDRASVEEQRYMSEHSGDPHPVLSDPLQGLAMLGVAVRDRLDLLRRPAPLSQGERDKAE